MREWEELVHDLETTEPPLTAESMNRIQTRVRDAMPRRHRKWLPIVLAASLLLSACGYAAATGQFDRWFWNFATDPAAPEESADLLTQLGTVIDQSQTVDDVTLTLEGALWDGEELVLSLTVEEGTLPNAYWTEVRSDSSWVRGSRKQMEEDFRRLSAERGLELEEEEIQEYLDTLLANWPSTKITLLKNRQAEACSLQVQTVYTADRDASELVLHLEDLTLRDTILRGPYEFTFTVERREIRNVYNGSVLIEHEALESPLEITRIELTPFRVTAEFRSDTQLPEGFAWQEVCIEQLRIGGEDVSAGYTNAFSMKDRISGNITAGPAGPRDRVMDPAAVEAIEIGGVWIELADLTPEES